MPFSKLSSICFAVFASLSSLLAPAAFADPIEYSGKVVAADGQPAAGARIRFLSLGFNRERPFAQALTSSKADGSFYVFVSDSELKNSRNEPHNDVLFAIKGSEVALIDFDNPRSAPKTITLQKTTPVKFHVVDSAGKPVAQIPVVVSAIVSDRLYFSNLDLGNPADAIWKGFTDKLGNALVPNVPLGADATFTIDSEKYASVDDIRLPNVDANSDAQTLRISHPGSISGQVVYSGTNKPVANIEVFVAPSGNSPRSYTVKTDSNGFYSVPKVPAGDYGLCPMLSGLRDYWAVEQKTNVEVREERPTDQVNFKLISGGIVEGKITNETTGKPANGIYICFLNNDKDRISENITINGDGTFKIHVVPGTIKFFVNQQLGPALQKSITVADGETKTLDWAIPVAPPERSIHGIAVDSKGDPVSGAKIYLFAQYCPDMVSTADAQGKFTMDSVKTGDFLIGSSAHFVSSAPVSVPDDGGEIKVVLDAAPFTVRGKTIDQDGKPVAGVKIYLTAMEEKRNISFSAGETATDANGNYTFKNVWKNFDYIGDAQSSGYFNLSRFSGQQDGAGIRNGAEFEMPPIKLAKTDGTVSGLVVDENDKPISGAKVLFGFDQDQYALSDSKGRFTLKHFPRGNCHIQAQKEGYQWPSGIDVKSGETDCTITLAKQAAPSASRPSGDREISGQVVDENGKPIANAAVDAYLVIKSDSSNEQIFCQPRTQTDAEGKFDISGLPADKDFHLIAQAEGYFIDEKENVVPHKPGEKSDLKFPLAKLDSFISGKVLDSIGKPVSGIIVSIDGANETLGDSMKTSADGSFHTPATLGKKATIEIYSPSGEHGSVTATGGSKDVVIRLQMPKRHGDGTPAKTLLDRAIRQAKINHKGFMIEFYSPYENANGYWRDKDSSPDIFGKYFTLLEIDTCDPHEAWGNYGWQWLRDPLSHKRIEQSKLSVYDSTGKLFEPSSNPGSDPSKISEILVDTLRKAAPQMTASEAKTLSNQIKVKIDLTKNGSQRNFFSYF